MKRLSIAYLILLGFIFSSGCTRKNFKFKPGDLLFQINESNSFTEAITGTTGNLRKYSFSHVAIISAEGKKYLLLKPFPVGECCKFPSRIF